MPKQEIESLGIELVTTDHVTDDPKGMDVKRAIKDLGKEEFDLLIICLSRMDSFPCGYCNYK